METTTSTMPVTRESARGSIIFTMGSVSAGVAGAADESSPGLSLSSSISSDEEDLFSESGGGTAVPAPTFTFISVTATLPPASYALIRNL